MKEKSVIILEALQVIVFILLVAGLALGLIFGIDRAADRYSANRCLDIGKITRYETAYISKDCWINVKDDLWIKENDIPEYLPFLLNENGE